ncbi:UDP-glucose 4-epimerase GalE [Flavobacteriaceae bacterium]|nr:UDP-glucose 4-epimerase GalE [Flavobacteriaceae bacterium]
MKILVTGGLGYIGAHTSVLLIEQGHQVIILDNLENSSLRVLDGIASITNQRPLFYQTDLRDRKAVVEIFNKHTDIDGVIHFAAYKAVGESVEQPLKYYDNNINGLIALLECLIPQEIPLIFSSSCTVYGQADRMPIDETSPMKKAASPYGYTKQIGENIIQDCALANSSFKAILLRYFNPIGAHATAQIGETPNGEPQNLIPYLTQAVAGKRTELRIFGDDYDTPDGTCIRDYIHVMDLAAAHLESLLYLHEGKNSSACECFNVGTGKGNSVLEVVKTFEKSTQKKVPYSIVARRPGDIVQAYADIHKIEKAMGWKAQYSLAEALQSAWKWEVHSAHLEAQ